MRASVIVAAAGIVWLCAPSAKAWTLPVDIYGLTADGRTIHIKPVIEAAGGFHAAGREAEFPALVQVRLQDVDDPSAWYDLPTPINLLVGADVDAVDPRQLVVKHTSLPFVEVNVLTANPGDSIEVSVQAGTTPEKATVTIPVVRPSLRVSLAGGRIQGLGLEESGIVVALVGLANAAGRKVTV